MKNQENDTFSLAHTTWKCQYHIVFTPKYHRKVIYGALRAEIGKILRELCRRKDVEIIEAHAMPDHIHILVSIPPNERVSSFMGYLKGKSTMIIFERYAHLKYKYGNRHFWSRGYYVSTVGINSATVQKYIREQEKAGSKLEQQSTLDNRKNNTIVPMYVDPKRIIASKNDPSLMLGSTLCLIDDEGDIQDVSEFVGKKSQENTKRFWAWTTLIFPATLQKN